MINLEHGVKVCFFLVFSDQIFLLDDQENILQVSPFKGSNEDTELQYLMQYLKQIHSLYFQNRVFDVRDILRFLFNKNQ